MAHAWNSVGLGMGGGLFLKDEMGRNIIARGVNLSSECKLPKYCGKAQEHLYRHNGDDGGDLYHHRTDISFIDRPFPLQDAQKHFANLKEWGLTYSYDPAYSERVVSIDPSSIAYDEDYIEYLIKLIEMMPSFGIVCCVDFHQDCFSSFSGGSGAPSWVLELAGFDVESLHETGAAYIESVARKNGEEIKDQIWPTNYTKLAARTMFTLFWAGDELAPRLRVDSQGTSSLHDDSPASGRGISTFLQTSYANAVCHLAKRLAHCSAFVAFDVMNEPHPGYLGTSDFHRYDELTELHYGLMPSPAQSFMLSAGYSQTVDRYVRSFPGPTRKSGSEKINVKGRKAWRSGMDCPWKRHGVWEVRTGNRTDPSKHYEAVILKHNYFQVHSSGPLKGQRIDMWKDYYVPFVTNLCNRLSEIKTGLQVLVEPIPNEFAPPWTGKLPANLIWSPHWYDLNSLFDKTFGPVTLDVQTLSRTLNLFSAGFFGRRGAAQNYGRQIKKIVRKGLLNPGPVPTLIGECGVPMDINGKSSFIEDKYRWQIRALDAMCTGLEEAFVSYTLWNYSPLNNHDEGDLWYRENFSIYTESRASPSTRRKSAREDRLLAKLNPEMASRQDKSPLYRDGRCLEAIIRPYPSRIAGTPRRMHYDRRSLRFDLEIELWHNEAGDGAMDAKAQTTEIFLPRYQYEGLEAWLEISTTRGHVRIAWQDQTLYWMCIRADGEDTPASARLSIAVIDPRTGRTIGEASAIEDAVEFLQDIIQVDLVRRAAKWMIILVPLVILYAFGFTYKCT